MHSVQSGSMSQHQVALLERALIILSKVGPAGWDEIPHDLRTSFTRYMAPEAWTQMPDPLTLREAALMVVRDAIARMGEFTVEAAGEPVPAAASPETIMAK